MIKISASVGRRGMNRPDDVRIVQELLNKNLPIPLRPVDVTGMVDDQTIAVIEEFQRRELNQAKPDGRVDPGGRTWAALVEGAEPQVPLDTTSNPAMDEITLEQLQAVMPNLSNAKATANLDLINAAMDEFDINTRLRIAAFLAQLAHESGQLRYMEELASGEAYEGRKDLGNTQPGDGKRYKGRGPIQLTGRKNYRTAGKDLGLDLENNPVTAATPQVGFRIAGWFWSKHGLNTLADSANFKEITHRINGGYNGLPDRERYYKLALRALPANP